MITREKLKELRNAEKVHAHWIVDDKCVYDDFMKTVEVLWRVADAAKDIYKIVMMAKAHRPIGLKAKSINLLALGESLAALDGKE